MWSHRTRLPAAILRSKRRMRLIMLAAARNCDRPFEAWEMALLDFAEDFADGRLGRIAQAKLQKAWDIHGNRVYHRPLQTQGVALCLIPNGSLREHIANATLKYFDVKENFRRKLFLDASEPANATVKPWRKGGLAVKVAAAAYAAAKDCRLAADDVLVLADACLDDGCPEGDSVVEHLRGPSPHFKTCWAVNLLLGKS